MDVKTGDVLACYGRGFVSKLISWFTPRLKFWKLAPSHVAIIAVVDEQVLVFESTTLNKLRDKLTGLSRRGVQVHLFSDWLESKKQLVRLLPLKVPMTRPNDCIEYLFDTHARQVEYSVRSAIHSASPLKNSADGEPMFCSALVSFALQKAGSVGTHVNCNEQTPWDVINFPCFDKPITLLKGDE